MRHHGFSCSSLYTVTPEQAQENLLIEGQMLAGKHFPAKKPTHTLLELLERYTQEIMPRKAPETQRSHRAAVVFWQERLGHKRLADLTRTDIITQRDTLSKRLSGNRCAPSQRDQAASLRS